MTTIDEQLTRSPVAARDLMRAIDDDEDPDDFMGDTDCPDGCAVEPDGICSHGYESAALTARVI